MINNWTKECNICGEYFTEYDGDKCPICNGGK